MSTKTAGWYTQRLEEFYAHDRAALREVTTCTAIKLFPRFEALVSGYWERERSLTGTGEQKKDERGISHAETCQIGLV